MKTLKKWAVLALLIALLPNGAGAAFAEELAYAHALAAEGNGKRTLFYVDALLKGMSARYDSYLEIGKGLRTAEGSYIHLEYTISPDLIPERSSLTVLVDDIPVQSVSLNPEGEAVKTLRIDLSRFELGQGFHKISLAALMRTSEFICEDPLNEKLWLTASSKSHVMLNLVQAFQEADFSWYPAPFYDKGSNAPLHAVIAVPDEPSSASFAAAARLAQYFAARAPERRLAIPVYPESELTEAMLQQKHVIWVGEYGAWKQAGARAEAAAREAHGEGALAQGAAALMPSPWNSGKTHLLLTGPGEKLVSGANMLSDEALIGQMRGKWLSVTEPPKALPDLSANRDEKAVFTTLKQLGFDRLTVQNVQQGTVQFSYTLPPDRVPGGLAALRLKYSHSDVILFDKSVMTVSVNGTPVKSVRLARQTAQGGMLEVPIDPAVIGPSRNVTVSVSFQFADPATGRQMERDFYCEDMLIDDWAVIDGSSSLHLELAERQAVDFSTLPFPFAGEDAWNHTFVLSPRWTHATLQAALTIAGHVGAFGPDTASLKLATAHAPDWKADASQANLIYVGPLGGLPAELNGFAGSLFRAEGERIAELSEHVAILGPLLENYAFIQLTESPLSPGRGLLIAAAASDARLDDLTAAYADPQQAYEWTGRFVFVTPDRKVVNYPGTRVMEPAPEMPIAPENGRWMQFSLGEAGFLAVAAAIVAALALVYGNLRKRTRRGKSSGGAS